MDFGLQKHLITVETWCIRVSLLKVIINLLRRNPNYSSTIVSFLFASVADTLWKR